MESHSDEWIRIGRQSTLYRWSPATASGGRKTEETAPTGTLSKARQRALKLASHMRAEDLRRWQSLLKPLNTENPPS